MKIDYSWIKNKSLDKKQLRKYCDSEKSVEMCWWLHTEVVDDGYIYQEIIKLLEDAQQGKNSVFRGDVMWVHINVEEVILENPQLDYEYKFTPIEFRENLLLWNDEKGTSSI